MGNFRSLDDAVCFAKVSRDRFVSSNGLFFFNVSIPFYLDRSYHCRGFVLDTQTTSLTLAEKKSYATTICNVELEPLMHVAVTKLVAPSFEGNEVIKTLNEEVYQKYVHECKRNLICKIFFTRWNSVPTENLCKQVKARWKLTQGWQWYHWVRAILVLILLLLRRYVNIRVKTLGICLVVHCSFYHGKWILIRILLRPRTCKFGWRSLVISLTNNGNCYRSKGSYICF